MEYTQAVGEGQNVNGSSLQLIFRHSNQVDSALYTHNNLNGLNKTRSYTAYGDNPAGAANVPATLDTFYNYGGHYEDGTGLVYMKARYYDPNIGSFISPDSIIPDPTNPVDYNRYLYARGNPLKYNDPTGHYTNDEIMQHFGVDSWESVEAEFQEGGSHAGLLGWLYMLQQGESGSGISAMQIYYTPGAAGTSNSELHGVFQRSSSGIISVALSELKSGNDTYSYDAGISLSEQVFASFALNSSAVYGGYRLDNGISGSPSTVHNYLHADAGQLAVATLKGGTGFGPMLAKAPFPQAQLAGSIYTGVGWITTGIFDFAIPIINGNYYTPGEAAVILGAGSYIDSTTGKNISPYIGPTIDTVRSFCWGTGCPR